MSQPTPHTSVCLCSCITGLHFLSLCYPSAGGRLLCRVGGGVWRVALSWQGGLPTFALRQSVLRQRQSARGAVSSSGPGHPIGNLRLWWHCYWFPHCFDSVAFEWRYVLAQWRDRISSVMDNRISSVMDGYFGLRLRNCLDNTGKFGLSMKPLCIEGAQRGDWKPWISGNRSCGFPREYAGARSRYVVSLHGISQQPFWQDAVLVNKLMPRARKTFAQHRVEYFVELESGF